MAAVRKATLSPFYCTAKADQAIGRVIDRLRRGSRRRGLITLQSERNLANLASVHPGYTRDLLRTLRGFDFLAIPVEKIIVPRRLAEVQNREVLPQLGRVGFVMQLLDANGVLDLRRAGIKNQLGHIDYRETFEDHQILQELRASFEGKNLEVIQRDREINNLTLYHNLWMVRVLLYKIALQKAVAIAEENITALAETRAIIANIGGFLHEMVAGFPIVLEGARDRVSRAAELLDQFNDPAASATLVAITERLEREIGVVEKARVSRQRQSGRRAPRNVIEEELVHLAQRRYRLTISPNGNWVLPQAGFRRVGPVLQRQVIDHRVEPDAVVRREQHIIDSITERIAINADAIATFRGVIELLETDGEIDYEFVASSLARCLLSYEKGRVRTKFKTRLMLKLALELVKTAALCHEQVAEERLRSFASSMLSLAEPQLVVLNNNLGGQLRRISVRQHLEMAIIAQNLDRDANLRSFSEAILGVVTQRRIMNSIGLTGELRQLAVDVSSSLEVDEHTELGIQRTKDRAQTLVNLFAKTRRLIMQKDRFRQQIERARTRYQVAARDLRASGRTGENDALRELAIEYARGKLVSLREHNAEIARTLRRVAVVAALIKYDLANKYADEDADVKALYLEEYDGLLARIDQLDAEYQSVFGARGEDLGLAHSFDIWRLGLRIG